MGAMRRLPPFADAILEQVTVERQSHFDSYGGPAITTSSRGRLPNGERVVVCVEAKAAESFGSRHLCGGGTERTRAALPRAAGGRPWISDYRV
jgi:hypothetical protein